MGGAVATMRPEQELFDWALHDKKKERSVLLEQYGRATCKETLFPQQPGMCKCCPRHAKFRPPHGETSHARYQKEKLKEILSAKTIRATKTVCGRAFITWRSKTHPPCPHLASFALDNNAENKDPAEKLLRPPATKELYKAGEEVYSNASMWNWACLHCAKVYSNDFANTTRMRPEKHYKENNGCCVLYIEKKKRTVLLCM